MDPHGINRHYTWYQRARHAVSTITTCGINGHDTRTHVAAHAPTLSAAQTMSPPVTANRRLFEKTPPKPWSSAHNRAVSANGGLYSAHESPTPCAAATHLYSNGMSNRVSSCGCRSRFMMICGRDSATSSIICNIGSVFGLQATRARLHLANQPPRALCGGNTKGICADHQLARTGFKLITIQYCRTRNAGWELMPNDSSMTRKSRGCKMPAKGKQLQP